MSVSFLPSRFLICRMGITRCLLLWLCRVPKQGWDTVGAIWSTPRVPAWEGSPSCLLLEDMLLPPTPAARVASGRTEDRDPAPGTLVLPSPPCPHTGSRGFMLQAWAARISRVGGHHRGGHRLALGPGLTVTLRTDDFSHLSSLFRSKSLITAPPSWGLYEVCEIPSANCTVLSQGHILGGCGSPGCCWLHY